MQLQPGVAGVDTTITSRLSPAAWALLERAQYDLERIEERLQHVASVRHELDLLTRQKRFVIYGVPHWQAIGAMLDMVIVDLASWLKGLWKDPGGLLHVVCAADELAAFARTWDWTSGENRVLAPDENATDSERATTIASIHASLIEGQKRFSRRAAISTSSPKLTPQGETYHHATTSLRS